MDFRRQKTYHDILSEQRESVEEHLVPDPRLRWLAAAAGAALYLAAIALLYWASDVAFLDRPEAGEVATWKRLLGMLLNTAAVGFSVIYLVSVVLWALKQASPKYFLVFGVLGLFAGLLVAFIL
ncbi:hypothetical protein [Emcibacter sp. SYSU 3D8]|uniref:hypothetical protein n=1 Tax=Emcibacter sp. SYSU 3D8 TaxID=3133969 RepID=UPI0031FE7983